MKAYAVIGANYGDEGKGLVTDWLASRNPAALVVRFNGGAQAGHTVVTPSGMRHVFSHFGSGTLAGASTYLSQHFIANPILYAEESRRLAPLFQGSIMLLIDPQARVTTPYEMMLGMDMEMQRKAKRHGSCGLGIFQTRQNEQALRAWEVITATESELRQRVVGICKALRAFATIYDDDAWNRPLIVERYLEDCAVMRHSCALATWQEVALPACVIFEGAQGLALDQDNTEDFPHLTPSSTGMTNVNALVQERAPHTLTTIYVTRPYMTRHGAGPLPGEQAALSYGAIQDATNVPNEHQGVMRYAYADPVATRARIERDRMRSQADRHALAVTCVDHLPPHRNMHVQQGGVHHCISLDAFIERLGPPAALLSYGPCRSDVVPVLNL